MYVKGIHIEWLIVGGVKVCIFILFNHISKFYNVMGNNKHIQKNNKKMHMKEGFNGDFLRLSNLHYQILKVFHFFMNHLFLIHRIKKTMVKKKRLIGWTLFSLFPLL